MRKWIFRAAIIIILLLAALVATAWFYPEKILCVDSGKVSAEVIVVLGGGADRPVRAAELFKAGVAPRIIISGEGDDEFYRQVLIRAGVPVGSIEVEGKSRTTHENAEFAIQRLRAENVRRVILVTSWYHSRRALGCFEYLAPEIQFYSRPSYFAFDRADWQRLGISRRLRLEFLKLPAYWVRDSKVGGLIRFTWGR